MRCSKVLPGACEVISVTQVTALWTNAYLHLYIGLVQTGGRPLPLPCAKLSHVLPSLAGRRVLVGQRSWSPNYRFMVDTVTCEGSNFFMVCFFLSFCLPIVWLWADPFLGTITLGCEAFCCEAFHVHVYAWELWWDYAHCFHFWEIRRSARLCTHAVGWIICLSIKSWVTLLKDALVKGPTICGLVYSSVLKQLIF